METRGWDRGTIEITPRDGPSSEHGFLVGLVILVDLLGRGSIRQGIRFGPSMSFLLIAGVAAAAVAAASAAYAAAGAARTVTAVAAANQVKSGNLSVSGYQGS